MIRLLKAFTEEIRYLRNEDGEWVIEAASEPASEQYNAWAKETGNVIVDADVTLAVKESLDNQRSVRYVHILVTYMTLDNFIKCEALLRKMALSGEGFDEALPESFRELVQNGIESAKEQLKAKEEEVAPMGEPVQDAEIVEEPAEEEVKRDPQDKAAPTVSLADLKKKAKGR